MATPLEEFAHDLPDGAFWITGRWFKKLVSLLVADRARAGSNMDETPSEQGRFLTPKTTDAGAAPRDFAPYDASTGSGSEKALKVGIRFGATTPQGIALGPGVTPWPTDFGDDGSTKAVFDVTASGLIWLQADVTPNPAGDGSAPAVVNEFSLDQGASFPAYDDSTGYAVVAVYSVSEGKLTILTSEGIGSQSYGYCGGEHYFDPI